MDFSGMRHPTGLAQPCRSKIALHLQEVDSQRQGPSQAHSQQVHARRHINAPGSFKVDCPGTGPMLSENETDCWNFLKQARDIPMETGTDMCKQSDTRDGKILENHSTGAWESERAGHNTCHPSLLQVLCFIAIQSLPPSLTESAATIWQ